MSIFKRAAALAAALAAAAILGAPANAATAKIPVPSAPGTAQTTYDITNYGNSDNVYLDDCASGTPFINHPTLYTPMAYWINADGSWSFVVPGCGTNPRVCVWNVSGGLEADPCDTGATQDKWWSNHTSGGLYWFKAEGVGCDWYSWNTWYLQLPCTSWKGNNNLWYFR